MDSDGRHPGYLSSTTHILLYVQLSTKHKIRMSNLCAQHDTVAETTEAELGTALGAVKVLPLKRST